MRERERKGGREIEKENRRDLQYVRKRMKEICLTEREREREKINKRDRNVLVLQILESTT